MNREQVLQLIEQKLNSTTQLGVVNHFHNSWDSNQLDPADALLGFPVYQVSSATAAPTDTDFNGKIRFQVDGTKYVLWAYLNYNNAGVITGAWKSVSLT